MLAEHCDTIYPGLVETGGVDNAGDSVPAQTVINGENLHVLEALTYTHGGKIDCIYIDPPYNTGAKDWKYNNDYVDGDDGYRHSKWLSFMERRLLVAKQLLNPDDSVLIVTIDEKEYLRLGLLLEQTFPEATIQMVTASVNPRAGVSRPDAFTRIDEYVFVVQFGSSEVLAVPFSVPSENSPSAKKPPIWFSLMRTGSNSSRADRPNLFYPIWITKEGRLHSVGDSIELGADRMTVRPPEPGLTAAWPLRPDGTENTWQLGPDSVRAAFSEGTARVSVRKAKVTVNYLRQAEKRRIEAGEILVKGRDDNGALILEHNPSAVRVTRPRTMWDVPAHDAGLYGSQLIKAVLGDKRFTYPKSLYAVEDALRFFVKDKPDATILDFFAGSGTTAHAVMRLNKQDDGRRRSISVTNNEVSADEQVKLREQALRPGDPEWEKWGICDYVTKPRVEAAITGRTPAGEPIKGAYKFTDEFPMADGFEANARFFTLTYEHPSLVEYGRSFDRIAPMLWMRAGQVGEILYDIDPSIGYALTDFYGVLTDPDKATQFVAEIEKKRSFTHVFVVTDNSAVYQQLAQAIGDEVETVQLYESYLTNFRINSGRDN